MVLLGTTGKPPLLNILAPHFLCVFLALDYPASLRSVEGDISIGHLLPGCLFLVFSLPIVNSVHLVNLSPLSYHTTPVLRAPCQLLCHVQPAAFPVFFFFFLWRVLGSFDPGPQSVFGFQQDFCFNRSLRWILPSFFSLLILKVFFFFLPASLYGGASYFVAKYFLMLLSPPLVDPPVDGAGGTLSSPARSRFFPSTPSHAVDLSSSLYWLSAEPVYQQTS